MTTEQAAELYLREHLREWSDKHYAMFNPLNKPIEELPIIYGFNNGGSDNCYNACLLAEDGTALGSHICSDEGYMPYDLGVFITAPDRHEHFRKHYPDGYRMDFVAGCDVLNHAGLMEAYKKNQEVKDAKR